MASSEDLYSGAGHYIPHDPMEVLLSKWAQDLYANKPMFPEEL